MTIEKINQTVLNWARPATTPLGVDFFCLTRKFLVYNLVGRNLKVKYRRSALGFLWTILNPLAMTAVYYFVFKIVLNVKLPNHLVFILSGVLHWNFASQTIFEGMESIVASTGLITKVPIPLSIFPYVATVTNFITLVLSMPVLLGVAFFSGAPLSFSMVLLPFYSLILFLLVYSISSILGVLYVLFRDLRHAMGIGVSLWFYGTPVLYDAKMIPPQYEWILYANPFGILFEDLHTIWVFGGWPAESHLLWISGWALSLVLLTSWIHKKFARGLVEQL